MQRREFFNSLSSTFRRKNEDKVIPRPPYFDDESAFYNECPTCDGVCATSCQEQIIFFDDDKTPYLKFDNSGCTYCDDCAINCPKEVLSVEKKDNININIEIDVLKCLSWNNTMCFSCKDPCLDNAIDFLSLFRPSINDKCTSCGFCISRCPSEAITIKKV